MEDGPRLRIEYKTFIKSSPVRSHVEMRYASAFTPSINSSERPAQSRTVIDV